MPAIKRGELPVRRTILFVVGGMLLGGIIHIAIVFLVPYYAGNDAWAQMGRFGRDGEFHALPIPEAGAEPIASLDPRMVQAVCRFNLDQRTRCGFRRSFLMNSGRSRYSTGAGAMSTASTIAPPSGLGSIWLF